jgi:hypothetical protein
MGRTPIHAFKPRKPPILDHYIKASIEGGMDDGGHYKELIYSGVQDRERAIEIRRALFRSASHLGVSLKCDVETDAAGVHHIRFHAIDKQVGRSHIARQAQGDPSSLSYNPYNPRGTA